MLCHKLLNRLRRILEPSMDRLGKAAAHIPLPPAFWTLLGLGFAVLSAMAYGGLIGGGSAAGGLLLLASGFLDMVDGSVARAMGKVSSLGAFFDSTVDRLAEIVVYAGITQGGAVSPLLVVSALSLSLMVSYVRARGEALGVAVSGIGVGERAERILVLVVASLLNVLVVGVLVVAGLAALTLIHRMIHIGRNLS